MQQENVYTFHSVEETVNFAHKIASQLHLRDVILLKGELGVGKSVFARAVIKALCGQETEVPSPTFTLVQTYQAPHLTLWHFDLYRLKHPEEVYELGIEEAYAHGVSLIEWPERLGNFLPKDYIEIEFTHGSHENERILSLKGWDNRFS
ncbi:MAG: tRNA (adenosine(37)-N6)-threonylcarbamoyltransferase complex ATPase subunit type 1 TsaE [Proteobacteria bacterium]|nr:tRNA (adenosine(37)-N6)-threonylcarbamoyltransferase complex ATPase subunit type 1 TsaE [Pseudomonadota bacterium]